MLSSSRCVLLLWLISLGGCLEAPIQVPESNGFNDRLRLDGLPVSETQQRTDPAFGPYRTGAGEVISEVYPVASTTGLDGRSSNLIQSDCLWLGHDSQHGAGDRVELNWEQTWTFAQPPEGPAFPPDERTLGTCTYSNPLTRDFLRATAVGFLNEEDAAELRALYASGNANALSDSDVGAWLPGQPLVLRCITPRREDGAAGYTCRMNEVAVYSTQLQRFHHDVADVAANPDGLCLGAPIRTRRETLGANTAMDPRPLEGHLPACVQRGSWRPERDSSLQLTSGMFSPSSRDLGPNLMVVDRLRTLRRGMTRNPVAGGEAWSWSTPVRLQMDQPRWQENFSASLYVARATLKLRQNGAALARPVQAALCLSDRPGGPCRYSCRASAQASGAIYELSAGNCTAASGAPAMPDVTPTHDNTQLDPVPGRPQTAPLRWEIRGAPALGSAAQVQIEFDLVARTPGGAALRADHGALDFARIPMGSRSKYLQTQLRNEGIEPLRIDRIELLGAHSGDFEWLLLDRPQALPLPLDALREPGAAAVSAIALGANFDQQPLLRFDVQPKQRLGVYQPVLADLNFSLYGGPLQVRHGVLIRPDVEFDFVAAARREARSEHGDWVQAEHPPRMLAVSAFAERGLPHVLAPGARISLAVAALPGNLGLREAHVRVSASRMPAGAALPPIFLALRMQSVSSALIDALPRVLSFPRQRAGQPNWSNNLLVNNVGELDGLIASLQIEGPDAAVFALDGAPLTPLVLPVAEPVVLTLSARSPRCTSTPRVYSAALAIKLRDGAIQRIPLHSQCTP